jgi:TPR repeat protein
MPRTFQKTTRMSNGLVSAAAGLTVLLAAFSFVAVPARAADFETAYAYFKQNQWLPAFLDFQILAVEGDSRAQAYIGMMYRRGLGISLDYAEAERWLRASAEQGDPTGNHRLGWMYARGEIAGERAFTEAVKYWKAAAEKGHHQAQMDLGVMYWRGEGVPQDYVLAYTWLDLASDDPELTAASSNRDNLAKVMTPEQVEDGKALAISMRDEIPELESLW